MSRLLKWRELLLFLNQWWSGDPGTLVAEREQPRVHQKVWRKVPPIHPKKTDFGWWDPDTCNPIGCGKGTLVFIFFNGIKSQLSRGALASKQTKGGVHLTLPQMVITIFFFKGTSCFGDHPPIRQLMISSKRKHKVMKKLGRIKKVRSLRGKGQLPKGVETWGSDILRAKWS